MTLRGAKLALRAESVAERGKADSKSDDMKLYESLQNLRTMLCEVRELLGEEGTLLEDETIGNEEISVSEPQLSEAAKPAKAKVAKEPKEPKPAEKEPAKEQPRPLFLEQTLF